MFGDKFRRIFRYLSIQVQKLSKLLQYFIVEIWQFLTLSRNPSRFSRYYYIESFTNVFQDSLGTLLTLCKYFLNTFKVLFSQPTDIFQDHIKCFTNIFQEPTPNQLPLRPFAAIFFWNYVELSRHSSGCFKTLCRHVFNPQKYHPCLNNIQHFSNI